MLSSLGMYSDKFEGPFLMDCRRFFLSDVQANLPVIQAGARAVDSSFDDSRTTSGALAVAAYLCYVEKRLAQAAEMSSVYLEPSTRPALNNCIEECALRPHASYLIQAGLPGLLHASKERLADLRRMFHMMDRVQNTELVKNGFAEYIK
jgi:hypothetical protein